MSVFSPLDVASPIDRRKQLLDKLMQQYSQNAQAQVPQPGAVHAMGSPFGGQPFRGAFEGQASPLTSITDPFSYKLPPGVAQGLGPGGLGGIGNGQPQNPHDASSSPGQPVERPSMPNPGAPSQPGPPGMPGAGGANGAVAPVGQAGAIPLGNGVYYDPVQDAIVNHGGSVAGMGQAASQPGGSASPTPGFRFGRI